MFEEKEEDAFLEEDFQEYRIKLKDLNLIGKKI